MLNFDYITLEKFIEENKEFLLGARLQKIQQPTRQELVFTIRSKVGWACQPNSNNQTKSETRKFYININPQIFHLCFMGESGEKKRHLQIPKSPPMFCMLLRKYLENARIAKVNQPQGERILEFYFETYNELSEKIYLCLAIELMGKHSNVVLYNYDTNVILGCMHNVGAEKSSVREIIGGLPYTYPPVRKNVITSGFSSVLEDKISVNDSIDNYFSDIQEQEKIKNLKSSLLSGAKAKLKKVQSTLEKLQKQSKTQEKMDFYRKNGDLIMANLFNNKDFAQEIEVFDYEANSDIKIELNETKTLKENANQFYKLYNKAKTATLKTEEMKNKLLQEREYLEQVLYSIDLAESVEDLLEIDEEGEREKGKKKQQCIKVKRQREKTSCVIARKGFIPDVAIPKIIQKSGSFLQTPFTIFVGKNNKQNDYIVSKLARSEDIWFHTHNCAGSHVLLRVESGQEVTDEIIFECAKLAKEYSSAKNSSKVGIIYTKAKNLKKPPAAALGYVTYKGEKEIVID